MLPCSHYIMSFYCVIIPLLVAAAFMGRGPYACLSIYTLILCCSDSCLYFRASSCHFLCLGQLFLAWGLDFRGSMNLDGKKITALYALTSN